REESGAWSLLKKAPVRARPIARSSSVVSDAERRRRARTSPSRSTTAMVKLGEAPATIEARDASCWASSGESWGPGPAQGTAAGGTGTGGGAEGTGGGCRWRRGWGASAPVAEPVPETASAPAAKTARTNQGEDRIPFSEI